jgi:hypothetical protein
VILQRCSDRDPTPTPLAAVGSREFPVANPVLWNQLPADVASFLSSSNRFLLSGIYFLSFPFKHDSFLSITLNQFTDAEFQILLSKLLYFFSKSWVIWKPAVVTVIFFDEKICYFSAHLILPGCDLHSATVILAAITELSLTWRIF